MMPLAPLSSANLSCNTRQQVNLFCYDAFIFIIKFVLIIYESSLEYYYQRVVEQTVDNSTQEKTHKLSIQTL